MRPILISFGVLAATVGATAQNTFVLPSAAASARPSVGSPWMSAVFFGRSSPTIPSASRSQSIYDSMDVGPAAATWTSLH